MSLRLAGRILFGLVLLATIASALAVVYARQESRARFIELNRLADERDDLEYEFGRLQLEQATWASHSRIEQIARLRLGMVSPDPAATILVRR